MTAAYAGEEGNFLGKDFFLTLSPALSNVKRYTSIVDNWINPENYKKSHTHRAKHFKAFFEKLLSYCQNTV